MPKLPSTSRALGACASGEKPPLLQPSIPGKAAKPIFSVGDVVLVRTDAFDKKGNLVEHVVEGYVRQVFPKKNVPFVTIKGKDYYNAIEVVEETFDGQEMLIRWSSDGGCDAIPDSEYGRVRKVFPGFENSRDLTEDENRSMDILRSHVRMRNSPHPVTALQSTADKVLLDEQGLCYILKKLSQKADPNDLISHVTSQDKNSLTYLAYLLARVMAGELGVSVERPLSPQDIRSRGQLILEALEAEDEPEPLSRLQTLDCPLLSVFMLTLMTSAYRGDKKGMFRSTFQKNNVAKLNSLVSRIETIMSILADTMYSRKLNKHLVGPAVKGIVMGCKLMVQNDGGVADSVIAQLHEQGCVCSPRTIRRAIDDAVTAIPEGNDVRRNTPDGSVTNS